MADDGCLLGFPDETMTLVHLPVTPPRHARLRRARHERARTQQVASAWGKMVENASIVRFDPAVVNSEKGNRCVDARTFAGPVAGVKVAGNIDNLK